MVEERERHSTGESSEKERTKTIVRRVGRVVFIGVGFLMFVAMMVGVVRGIQQDRAWDPYTGRPQDQGRCLEESRELMLEAGEHGELSPAWINRYREWVAGCKDTHGEVYELLDETRSELQR